MARSVLNSKNSPCLENVDMFTKFHEPINQAPLPLNLAFRLRKTIKAWFSLATQP